MKKLLILFCLFFLVAGVSFFKKGKVEELDEPMQQKEEEVSDILILNQEEIMSWIETIQEEVKLELKENEIDAEIELTGDLLNQLPVKETIKEVLMLFENESLACRIFFENNQLTVENCNIKGMSIPESIYHFELEEINQTIKKLMEEYGIDEIKICDESIKIQGDISGILKKDFDW